jgi:hypothetical protein
MNVVKSSILLLPVLARSLALTVGAQQRFAIAIVRLDGRLVPFAAYDGTHWERAWVEADQATEGRHTIDGTDSIWRRRGDRVPRVWSVWPASGARVRRSLAASHAFACIRDINPNC